MPWQSVRRGRKFSRIKWLKCGSPSHYRRRSYDNTSRSGWELEERKGEREMRRGEREGGGRLAASCLSHLVAHSHTLQQLWWNETASVRAVGVRRERREWWKDWWEGDEKEGGMLKKRSRRTLDKRIRPRGEPDGGRRAKQLFGVTVRRASHCRHTCDYKKCDYTLKEEIIWLTC